MYSKSYAIVDIFNSIYYYERVPSVFRSRSLHNSSHVTKSNLNLSTVLNVN